MLAVLFYQVLLKLNVIATAALRRDWKHIKNNACHYSDKNQGAECYVPTSGSYTAFAQESMCSLLFSLAHVAQTLEALEVPETNAEAPSLPALWIRLKNAHFSACWEQSWQKASSATAEKRVALQVQTPFPYPAQSLCP